MVFHEGLDIYILKSRLLSFKLLCATTEILGSQVKRKFLIKKLVVHLPSQLLVWERFFRNTKMTCSNSGSNEIAQKVFQHYTDGKIRETLTLKEVEDAVIASAFNTEGK